ncbi:PQQ-dependent sugar dehydrogenase [Flexithrix dorotheae]|uniref:PQQ-dependent sugar dehydrogenase n=1 Tax=Flexithrix dorotheae TaxID=70993 RepID=UPI000477D1F7|nr:PQQ-dependent sugar dehydrogenase [Flexithrix dorotheae]
MKKTNTLLLLLAQLFFLHHSLIALDGLKKASEVKYNFQLPEKFQDELITSGLQQPTDVEFLPNSKAIISQKDGKIWIVDPYSTSPELKQLIQLENVDKEFERGLLTMVVDPDFETNGYFYAYYSTTDYKLKLSRFKIVDEKASLDSETVIWETEPNYLNPAVNHYHMGGALDFANDGTIFLVIGDLEEPNNAQNLKEYNGKLLRINKDGSIPNDNPFYNNGLGQGPNGELSEIYAWGLRNPFKGTTDKETGIFIMGEVGGNKHESSWEDVHYAVKEANYGWPDCGESGRDEDGSCVGPNFVDPIYTYAHIPNRGNSITGGFIYRGTNLPQEYQGQYIFADYAQSWIRFIRMDENLVPLDGSGEENATTIRKPTGFGLVDIEVGPKGELFYLLFNVKEPNSGEFKKIFFAGESTPIITKAKADILQGENPLQVNFEGSAKITDNSPLTYTWNFGDGNIANSANATHTYTDKGTYKARLTVSTQENVSVNSDEITIKVGKLPVANILSPLNGTKFKAGQVIQYNGEASDPDGVIKDENYRWDVEFLHDDHTHPFIDGQIGKAGQVKLASSGHSFDGETGFIFSLTVTDSDNLSTSVSDTVFPQKAELSLATDPMGLTIHLEGNPRPTPFKINELVGFESEVSIISPQTLNGKTYQFVGWSDNGAKTHIYKNPDINSTLTAYFTELETTLLEAEDHFQIVRDTVLDPPKAAIGILGFELASNKKAVSIYDKGDVIKIPFTTKTDGDYLINVRVRSGVEGNAQNYWPNGYLFKLDGNDVTLVGDEETLTYTPEQGKMYLGIMKSEKIKLSPGQHELFIEANSNWGNVDYVDIIKTNDDTPPTAPTLSKNKVTDKTVSLQWSPSLDNSGIDGYIVYQNGDSIAKTPKIEFIASKLTPDTNYEFNVVGVDKTKNRSELSNTIKVKTSAKVSNEAGVLIKYPCEGEIVQGPDLEVGYALFGNNNLYDHLYFTLDDNPKKMGHDLSSEGFLFNNLEPGEHTIKIDLVYGHGKPLSFENATATVNFTVEYSNDPNILPGIVLLNPEKDGLEFGTSIKVDYLTFGNTEEIKDIKLKLGDNTPIVLPDQSGSYTINNVNPGNYELVASIYDLDGAIISSPNSMSSVNFQMVTSTNTPRVKIKSPVNKAFIYENDFTVEFELFGDNSLYDHIELILDDTLIIPYYKLKEPSFTFKGMEKGEHKIAIQMVTSHPQPLPNPESRDEVIFTVEGEEGKPKVKIISPTENQIFFNSKIKVDYELSGDPNAFDHLHFYLGEGPHETVTDLSGSYTLKKEVPAGEYFLKIQLVNEGHDPVDFNTAVDSVKIKISSILPGPSNLMATVQNHTKVYLNWDKIMSDQITGYKIEMGESADGPFETIGEVGKDINNFVKSDVNENTVLYFRIITLSGANSSKPSDVLEVKTNNIPIFKTFTLEGLEDKNFKFNYNVISTFFEDPDEDPLKSIKVVTLPSNGKLLKGEKVISENEVISQSGLDSLIFAPDENWSGNTGFEIKGNDGFIFSDATKANIKIKEVNDLPTALILNDSTIEEGNSIGDIIGTFSTTDVDDNNHTYSIVNKALVGNQFGIDKNLLVAKVPFKFNDPQNSYSVVVETMDDQGGKFKKSFLISIEQKQVTGIPEELLINGVSVFPNPFNNQIFIEIDNENLGGYEIKIIDLSGKMIAREVMEKTSKTLNKKIELPSIPKGLYLLRITNNKHSFIEKIYKEN